MTLRIDKYFGEFNGVVKVDNAELNSGYIATAESTLITLKADHLNTLSVGSHTLMVGFQGGVWVSSGFTILSIPATPTVPSSPSG
ncbi:MAG: hypothetical protein LBU27_08500 [Candidatus Peribacteria bacterium]|nr:hypothetical protein [Candidatus Peribacteria bacterium]